MRAEDLLHAAVANNARWCNTVCRSHGYPGEFTLRVWISARHALPFYPNAITLAPDATAAETGADQGSARPLRPGLPVVGYEAGADLAAARRAGFQVLGPLRVRTRAPAP